jgi:O-antigen biosynthesis alpha-1,3-mannosyltransferase
LFTNSNLKAGLAEKFNKPNIKICDILHEKPVNNKLGLALAKIKNNKIFQKISSDYDVIHQTNQFFLIKGVKNLVSTVHDVIPLNKNLYDQNSYFVKKYRKKVDYALQNARVILVPTQFVKNEIMIYYPQYFPKMTDRIIVTHLGVSDDFCPKAITPELKHRISLPAESKYFLFVGNLFTRKNLQRCINAYAMLPPESQKEYKLVCIMNKNDDYKPLLSKLSPDCIQNIYFTSSHSNDELMELYSSCTALLFPSLAEGFGLPVLEAMKCGCPIITSNISCLPEVAGDAALYVNPLNEEEISNGMKILTEDETLRSKLTERGLDRVKEFTWANTARTSFDAYKKALELQKR